MEERRLNDEVMARAAGGFPDGEFPQGHQLCPKCGTKKEDLIFITEIQAAQPESAIAQLRDMIPYRLYRCPKCGFKFWMYAEFWEKE